MVFRIHREHRKKNRNRESSATWAWIWTRCGGVVHVFQDTELSTNDSIAGYLTTLRHNDFLPSVSPRYDHSFGFSPRITVFYISNSDNLQIILIFSTTIRLYFWLLTTLFLIINHLTMPFISFNWGIYQGEIESYRTRGASTKDI